MNKLSFLFALLFLLSLPLALDAKSSYGKIKRSPAARSQFMKTNPCPSTGKSSDACSGFVVDHIVPLKRGGADHPSNMQWQTKEDAKRKDKWE
jgi:hypothetical protein